MFQVFSPANTIGLVSVCSISFNSLGDNFMCGNDQSKITTALQKDPQAAGNMVGMVDLGTLLNKGDDLDNDSCSFETVVDYSIYNDVANVFV